MAGAVSCLHLTTPLAEQEWITQQLAEPVHAPRLRLWTYPAPGVVLGCSQGGLLPQVQRAAPPECEIALRRAGGGAVLTGPWMLSASVVLPPEHRLLAGGLVASYHWLGAVHAGLLRDMGIDAHAIAPEELGHSRSRPGLAWACFGGLSPWEVVVDGRKLVGLAQFRRRNGVLLTSGTLMFRPKWEVLCQALERPPADAAALDDCTLSCADALGAPVTAEAFARDLYDTFSDIVGRAVQDDGPERPVFAPREPGRPAP